MGRAKLKMELIPKDKSRNSSYLKRRMGIMKKAFEFSTLCGVDTCMIIYGPKQGNRPIEPETYPNKPDQVHRIIHRYLSTAKEGRTNRSYGISDFFGDVNRKMEDVLVKSRETNDRNELSTWDAGLEGFNLDQLKELTENLDSKIEMINSRINLMKGSQNVQRMINYSRGAANHNPYFNMSSTSDDLGARERENDMLFQQQHQPLYFATPVGHQAMINMDSYPSDTTLIFDNTPAPTLLNTLINTGFNNQYTSGPIESFPYQMVRNPSFRYDCDPTVWMPYQEIDQPQGAGYYPVQPNPYYLPCFEPGSSSCSSSSQVIHHSHHHQQPSDELPDYDELN